MQAAMRILMDFGVILGFIAMVLAPCGVALWGRLREGADEERAEAEATAIGEQGPVTARLENQAVNGRLARGLRRLKSVFFQAGLQEVSEERAEFASGLPQVEKETSQPVGSVGLEELWREALESARIARAASLRADAAASEAAARVAAVRVEAATEQAARAHLDACQAAELARLAEEAYEAARAQADESRRTLHVVSERRAA